LTPSPIVPELPTPKERHPIAIEKKPITVKKKILLNKENVKHTLVKRRNLSQEPIQTTRQTIPRKISSHLLDLNNSTIKINKPRLSSTNPIESNKLLVKQKSTTNNNKFAHKPENNKDGSVKKNVVAITRIEFSDLDNQQNIDGNFDSKTPKLIRLPLLNKKKI
jgi:hypothetical protein